MDEVRKVIEEVLEKAAVLDLATSRDSQTWIAPLLFVHDQRLNVYWLSHKDTRHSQELLQNPSCAVAITIVDEMSRGKNLQMSGKATEVIDEAEKEIVHEKYHKRHHEPKHRSREEAQKEMEKLTLYKFSPKVIKVTSEVDWGHERKDYGL